MFKTYQTQINDALLQTVLEMGPQTLLRDACEYSLMSEGKRIRPLIVLMVADALNFKMNVMPAALSVELFHTASLIADDLPCMDNDDVRRSRASLHKKFGESTAILTSYALIAAGYREIYKNGQAMKKHDRCAGQASDTALFCIDLASQAAGIQGAVSGQFLDLFPPDQAKETIEKIIYQKTVTLFEIAFVFGWFFGGGDPSRLKELQSVAYHFGMAFQIADDVSDDVQDLKGLKETNISALLGKEEATSLFHQEMILLEQNLKELGLWTDAFQTLYLNLLDKALKGF